MKLKDRTYTLQAVNTDGTAGAVLERRCEGWITKAAVTCACQKFVLHQVAVIDEHTGQRVATFERDYNIKRNQWFARHVHGKRRFS
jgi:hypothetical protein